MSRVRTSATFAAAAVALAGSFEGLRQTAYRDPVGVATICYGETKNVRMGMTASRAQCDAMLIRSLIEHEDGMLRCLRADLPDGAHLAFLDLTYNIGVRAFCRSSVALLANAGDVGAACDRLPQFNKAGGIVFPGLTRRREAERKICRGSLREER